MRSRPIPAVGIDLGTTYSAVARLDETGRPVTLANAEGEKITPSLVLFDEENVVVGTEALKAMATEANHVAQCAKRDMGMRSFHKSIKGNHYPPEVIEAWILNKLRIDAVTQIGPFEKVVITVPAYFDEVRRKATQDAGYMAGFDVLDIINEPTAAAVAFGYQQGRLDPEANRERTERILVYDLGGGTFDVTVMEIRGSNFVALATDGDVQLGGYDWDRRLVDLVADAFLGEHALDPREDAVATGKLWRDCEDAKRILSARPKAAVACDYRGHRSHVEIRREGFEEKTRDLVDRTRFTTMQTLKAAGLKWSKIDRILLAGGSTRMPMVRRMLREISGKDPNTQVAADEAVAHGAALRAGQILAEARGKPAAFAIKNVNSHSLGVVGTDPQTKRKRNGILIPRNTPIPVTAKRTFKTQKENQKSILVEVVEGESRSAEDCTPIGRCTISRLPPNLPRQSSIDVTFRYRPNGRLKVRVTVPGAKAKVDTEFTRANSLSKEDLDGWRRFVVGEKPADGC